ncbi:MAG: nucleotidyltransferase family protein [SAR202 cluster bacterium]|nr:nucleotidyltransferase family protein [SAR202 cluster bacterium]|tara:strand:+ start:46431 stop:47027 length:597 start_codon:yes stop_codon:yes gene_type:complete
MSGFVTAILLSAGKSTRMGYPKALLDWQGIPLIRYQVENLIKGGVSQVIVVLGHDHKEISKYVTDSQAELIINERYDKGKITSIHKGISVVSDESSDIMILSVDQPRDYKIIRDLIKSHSASKSLISIPSNGVKSGHPIMFSVVLKGKLFEISESNKGLKALIDEYRAKINYVNFKNKTIFLDMNTDEEYKLAKKIFR